MKKTLTTLMTVVFAVSIVTQPVRAEPPESTRGLFGNSLSLKAHLSERLDFRARLPSPASEPEQSVPAAQLGTGMLGERLSRQALVDWDLEADGLRMTGGALQPHSRTAPTVLEGMTRTRQPLSLDEPWRPYLGLGWDYTSGKAERLDIQLDLGVVFESIGADATGGAFDDDTRLLNQDAFLHQAFESFRYRPAFSAGLEYRF